MFITVKFESRAANADNGKIVITIDHDGSTVIDNMADSATINVRFTVTGPAGVIHNTVGGTAAITSLASGSTATLKLSIPVDIDGRYYEGDYTVLAQIEDAGNLGAFDEFESTHEFCVITKGALRFASNCAVPSLQLFDVTNYSGYSLLSRVLKLVHPVIEGEDEIPDTTTASGNILIYPTHSGVTYTGILTTTVSSVVDDDDNKVSWEYFEDWTATDSYQLICAYDLSGLAACVKNKVAQLRMKANKVGGWPAMSKAEQDLLYTINAVWMQYAMSKECGDWAGMSEYYSELKTLLNCNCCNADDVTTLQALNSGNIGLIPDAMWQDVPEDAYINGWSSSTWDAQYKIVNGALYVRGVLINTTIASGSHISSGFFDTSWLTNLGIYPAQNYFQQVTHARDATVKNFHIGEAFFGSNAWAFQLNDAYVSSEPVRLSFVIPLDGQQGEGIS